MKRYPFALMAVLLGACGTDVGGPAVTALSCVYGETRSVAVGEAITLSGTGHRSLCLEADEHPAIFAYVPFHAEQSQDDTESLQFSLEVLGAGASEDALSAALPVGNVGDAGARWPDPADGATPRLGWDLHRQLREREIAELEPLIRGPGAGPAGAAPAVTVETVPDVGDRFQLNVALSCTVEQLRTVQVVRVSEQAIVVVDESHPTGLTMADYDHFALSFDTLIYPVATHHFGEPSDIDQNGRVIIMFTGAVNQRNPPGSSTVTAAMFWSGDLFPDVATSRLEACPGGNQAEMFYVAIPDPNGVLGPALPVRWLRERVIHVLAHEYQHLLNAARRLYVNEASTFERTWLNEGLSHIAEELIFYQVAGLDRRSNINSAMLQGSPAALEAFARHMTSNTENLGRYLQQVKAKSLMGPDELATRGATWSFLRYAADRSGRTDASVLGDLVNARTAGLDNLNRVLGASALDWMHDWAVSLYADDAVPGLDPRFTNPSWNLRDVYAWIWQGYPLAPQSLNPGSVNQLTLLPGGASHLLFGVDAHGRAALHVEGDGDAPPRALRGSFLRIR
jgi:hypothetical protein